MWNYFSSFFGSQESGNQSDSHRQTCYYELLGVSSSATDLELKKAYRRRALELHPDKNPSRVQEATALFTEIQQAYEVLSDPDERAWYDSHRESILRGGDVDAEINTSMGPTVDQIMKFCSVSCFRGYGNDENGFFSVYSGLFAEILRQEEQAGLDIESLGLDTLDVDFGLSKHAWEETFLTRDRNGTSVKEFYAVMQSFSSTRWMDRYKLSDAPDRRTKRYMQSENKGFRDKARHEYSVAICDLAAFVKKRDPRFKQFQKEANERREASFAAQREANKAEQEKRASAARQFVEPSWSRPVNSIDENDLYTDSRGASDGSFDSCSDDGFIVKEENNDYWCIACNKIFKNENQVGNHLSSRKHIKAIDKLKEEMLEDEEVLQNTTRLAASVPSSPDNSSPVHTKEKTRSEYMDEGMIEGSERHLFEDASEVPFISDEETELGVESKSGEPIPSVAVVSDDDDWGYKKGKKARKSKRRAGKSGAEAITQSFKDLNLGKERCNVCMTGFASRTKLFEHIRETGHASESGSTGMKLKKKKN